MSRKFLTDVDLQGKLLVAGSGGTNGYFLKTDGSGNISWAAASGGSFTGGILTSGLTLVAGNTSVYPLTFNNNAGTPSASVGTMDFSTSTGLQFTNNATTGRGSVNVAHVYSIASTTSYSTTDASISVFPALTNGISLETGTRYEFEGVFMFSVTATFFSSGTTTGTINLGFALPTTTYAHAEFYSTSGATSTFGSATDTLIFNAETTALTTNGAGVATATRTTAGTATTYAYVKVRGHLKTSASGNFNPTLTITTTGLGSSGGSILAGSWISIKKTPETMGAWT